MKSGWLVGPAYDGTKKQYEVYRLIDALGENVAENREVHGSYPTRDGAVSAAKDLNKQAAENFWKQ